jgi:hypothetical protein
VSTRRAPLVGLLLVVSSMPGCAGCVGTGHHLVPLTPDPPTPVSIRIYDSDIHLINDSDEDLRGMAVSVRSALGGLTHSRSVGDLEKKGYLLLPSAETGWYLAEGEVLTVEADGHSPTRFSVRLRARSGR